MDDHHLDVMNAVDRRLDLLVPDVPLPPDLLLRGERVRRRRTTIRIVAAAAAIVVAAGIGTVIALDTGSTAQPPVTDQQAPSATETPRVQHSEPQVPVPEGMRLVGFDELAFAVPDGWTAGSSDCLAGTSDLPTVVFADPEDDRSCGSLTFVRARTISDDDVPLRGHRDVTLNGLEMSRLDGCPPTADCVYQTFTDLHVPNLRTDLFVAGSNGDRAMIRQIADSIRPLPGDLVAVPVIDCCPEDPQAIRILEAAGLTADLPDVNFPHYVTGTAPAAGTLLEPGTKVELLLGDG